MNGSGTDDVTDAGFRAPQSVFRPRLLTVVQGRWDRPVTAVVAGAGFGKSTLLGQAVSENRLLGIGEDVMVRLEPADASPFHLAARLLGALGEDTPPFAGSEDLSELVALVVDVIWGRAPEAICLVLDDAHEIAAGSPSLALLDRLFQQLPANGHVLMGARALPEVGIARLAVDGRAFALREEDLRFTEAEVCEFAHMRGVPAEQVSPAHGWPALAELLARATGVTTGEYVWEQVIAPLPAESQARVLEVAALGGADEALASAVAGIPADLDAVLSGVPLVSRSRTGWWELHDVIAEQILARAPDEQLAAIRRRGGVSAREHQDHDRAIRLLVASEAWDEVLRTLRDIYVTLGAPEDPWLAAIWVPLMPSELRTEPEVLLLEAIAVSITDAERGFQLGALAVAAFGESGDVDGEVASLARMGAIAYGLQNAFLMQPYAERVAELAGTGHPWALSFDAVMRGAFALMVGRWREAEEILARVASDPASDPSQGLAAYLCARSQVQLGRFDEAARTVERMPEAHRERVRDGVIGVQVAIAQARGASMEALEEVTVAASARIDRRPVLNRRIARCRLAVGFATIGDLDAAREQLMELELIGPPIDATQDEELIAAAAVAVLAGSEAEAATLLARVPDRGVFFPPVDSMVLLYVLRPDVRERYDALDLEGVYQLRRRFAAAFVAARAGDAEPLGRFDWPRAAVVRWFAPPPWLVEAAVVSAAAGGTPPTELINGLGPSHRGVLRDLSASPVRAVARVAAATAASLPPSPPGRLAVRVLGTSEIDIDDLPSTAPELRRERVQSMLGLLVLRRSIRRLEMAAALWPDLGEDAALGNLRVTLAHLLRLIEPRRAKNAPSFFVRQENDRLTLHEDPALSVDAWEFEEAVDEAERLERSGAPSLALESHVRAVELWRGELLADVNDQEWLHFERMRLGTRFVRSALRAGELLAAHHELTHAAVMAERAVSADPWGEAPYRLLASIHLDRGDRSAARRVLAHLENVLDELGIDAEPATEALRRRCGRAVNGP